MDEIILRSGKKDRERMDKERLQMIFTFVQILVGELLVFGFAVEVVYFMGTAGR